jgi:hypothetical protein
MVDRRKEIMCGKCFRVFLEQEGNFYYNKNQNRYYTKCKDCYQPKSKNVSNKLPETLSEKFISIGKRVAARHKKKGWKGDIITSTELFYQYYITNGKCFYTGLVYTLEKDSNPLKMTVDRIDSSLGYVPGNVVLCCWFVNCAKNSWNLETMKKLWSYLPTK